MNGDPLGFDQLRHTNAMRRERWQGKPVPIEDGDTSLRAAYDLVFVSNELCGEAGEAANFVKKLARNLAGAVGGLPVSQVRDKIAEELADTVICADLLAQVCGIDLALAIRQKFNATSAKHGFPERL